MTKDKRRILIVDDEEGIRESFKLILGESYQLSFAANALEATTELQRERPDLVILDIKMPKVNGLEFLKQIKAKDSSLPVIIVTGYQSVETAQEAAKNGASDYIPKPFESQQIIKAVADQLEEK